MPESFHDSSILLQLLQPVRATGRRLLGGHKLYATVNLGWSASEWITTDAAYSGAALTYFQVAAFSAFHLVALTFSNLTPSCVRFKGRLALGTTLAVAGWKSLT